MLVATQRTNATLQTGSGTNTILGGAGSMSNAVADNSDTTGVSLGARASLDAQRVRLQVQAPTLGAGDRVYSVGVRLRMRSVVLADPNDERPLLLGWLRTWSGTAVVAGEQPEPKWTAFDRTAPVDLIASSVQDINLGEFTTAPGGESWTAANLSTLAVEFGRGDDSAYPLHVLAVFFDVHYQQPATVTVLTPTSPSSDTAATVTWDHDSSTFSPVQEWRAGVWPADQAAAPEFAPFTTPALWVSGVEGVDADASWWVPGEAQQWTTGPLTDGDYTAFVQVASQWPGYGGRFTTDPESITWTRDAAPADPPEPATLTTTGYDRAQMRILFTVTPGSPTDRYTLFRCVDGETWTPAAPSLTLVAGDGNNPVELYDRLMPLNTPIRYRVVAYAGTPLVAATAPSNEVTVTAAEDRVILRHPTNDLLDTAIVIKSPKGDDGIRRTRQQMQGVADFAGGPDVYVPAMMLWGPFYGWEYDLTLLFIDSDDPTLRQRVEDLDAASSPLMLQWPTGEALWGGLGPGRSGRPTEETFNVVAGNRAAYSWVRRKSMFTQCAPPVDY